MAFLVSPHLIEAILCLVLIEAFVLVFAFRRKASAVLLLLLPGVFLLLALRAALAGASWPWLPLFLSAALISHLADVFHR